MDYYLWDRLKGFVNRSNPTTTQEILDRIELFMDTEYDQNEMERAIIGTVGERGERVGGLPSRLRATWTHGGRSMNDVRRADRLLAPKIPLIGPMNRPL